MRLVLVVLLSRLALAQSAPCIDLSGEWKLALDGDDPAFAQPGYDDRDWTAIHLPSCRGWGQRDDVTVVTVRRHASAAKDGPVRPGLPAMATASPEQAKARSHEVCQARESVQSPGPGLPAASTVERAAR